MTVTSKTTADGGADINGDLKLLGSADGTIKLLYINEDGKVQSVDEAVIEELRGTLFPAWDPVAPVDCFDTPPVPSPYWFQAPGVLYTNASGCYEQPSVGIGTNQPSERLHVEGQSYFSRGIGIGSQPGYASCINVTNPETYQTGIRMNLTSAEGYSDGVTGIKLQLNDTNDEADHTGFDLVMLGSGEGATGISVHTDSDESMAFRVTSSGTDKIRMLNSGEIWATAVYVRVAPFPDYVFDPERKLMSLNQLEAYIKEHRRLPGMPSAEQVEKNGADLGEINRLLVEKVEELTLYVIELNKRIEELEKQQQ